MMNKKRFFNVFCAKCFVSAILLLTVFDPVYPVWAHYLDQSVIENARRATVGVMKSANETEQPQFNNFLGTGVYIGDGYIITARHVVFVSDEVDILPKIFLLTSNFYELTADLIGADESSDIAIYRLSIEHRFLMGFKAEIGIRELASGDDIFTIGNSLGWWQIEKFGHAGNTNRYLPVNILKTRVVQLDVPVCSGDSGGGVFNEQGELVGIVSAILPTEVSVGGYGCSRFTFATPLKIIQRVVPQLIGGKKPSFSFIGIEMKMIKSRNRWVTSVKASHGPALKAGILPGDIIVSINGREILDAARLKSFVVEETNPGDTLSILILRAGKERVISVTTGST